MKRLCIVAIIIISILFCQTTVFADNIIITEYKSEESEQYLWDTLMKYTNNNQELTAGILGYFMRESQLRSDAIAGWPIRDIQSQTNSSVEFTKLIDAGLEDGSTRDYFIEKVGINFGGYGLGQWLSYTSQLYDFAQKWGTSIGDAEMQCAFIVWSLENDTPELWEDIMIGDKTAEQIGRRIGYIYDGTRWGTETIASLARGYFKKYATLE